MPTMADWREEDDLQFLSYYEEHTVLWYAKHMKHFNKISRNDAWIEIAQKMGKSMEECKRKMTCLLASMRREKIKIVFHPSCIEPGLPPSFFLSIFVE